MKEKRSRRWSAAQRRKFMATAKAKKSARLSGARPAGAPVLQFRFLHAARVAVADDVRRGKRDVLGCRAVLLSLLALAELETQGPTPQE